MKIQFIKGLRANYNQDIYRDGIYFAENTGEILVNGVAYGLSTLTKNEIYTAINAKVATVNFTAPGKFEFIDGLGNVINTVQLVTASQKTAGFMSAEDKKALDDLVAGKFTVRANDPLLALNESRELFSAIQLSYDSQAKKINLFGQDANNPISSIDASDFIKDGMLSNVELVVNPEGQLEGTYLKLTFNLDSGKDSVFVNVSNLIDQYNGANLLLTGYKALETESTPITAEDSLNLAIAKLAKLIEENEQISASAFNDLNNRINAMNSHIENAGVEVLQAAKDYTDDSLTWILA